MIHSCGSPGLWRPVTIGQSLRVRRPGERYCATVTKAGVLSGSKPFHWLSVILPCARSMSVAPCARSTVIALVCSVDDAAPTATSIPDFLGSASSCLALESADSLTGGSESPIVFSAPANDPTQAPVGAP